MIDFLPETFSRITAVNLVVPVSGKPDLVDPHNGFVVVPAFVELYLRRDEGLPGTDREYAHASVSGPRRLKSGSEGRSISSFGWERPRNRGGRRTVARPPWLAQELYDLMPAGWSMRLVNLTDEAVIR
ncbi:hypothetical protein ACFRDV_22320 [Streptomyces fagopyri]|uniref:hypothetical protein n=1 Tax=Streptomyces fagopyri TaxID=2662397 RepID=UPI00367FF84E